MAYEGLLETSPDDQMFYIQNGFVGNAVMWWGIDGHGYTSDFNLAGKYTKEQTMKIIERPQDIAWPCDYIDNHPVAKKTIIDGQYLSKEFRIVGQRK